MARKKTKVQIVRAAAAATGKKPKRGGKSAKVKGSGFEREMVKLLCEAGIYAEKVPLSGAVKGGSFEGDINVSIRNQFGVSVRKFECKIRARAWADLYKYLEGNFGLFIRRDRSEPLVVLRFSDFTALHGETW